MHRIDGEGATPEKLFTEGNPLTGAVPTVVTAAWLNDLQENILRVLLEAQVPPVKGRDRDLWDAIEKSIMTRLMAAINQVMAALAAKTFVGMPDTPPDYHTPVPYVGGAIVRVRNAGDRVRFADNVRIEGGCLHVNYHPESEQELHAGTVQGVLTVWNGAWNGRGALLFRVDHNGAAFANGPYSGSGADYAERFESLTGQRIAPGASVALEAGKVRAATPDDDPETIVGVIRPEGAAGMVGNDAALNWAGKYLTDDYGAPLTLTRSVWRWFDEDFDATRTAPAEGARRPRSVPKDAVLAEIVAPALNPAFDPARAYAPRSERPEWVVVGLLGQIPVTNGQPVHPRWRPITALSDGVTKYLVC